MSIKIMSLVWDESEAKGSDLLLMLAIADNANDQGVAWPSIKTLSRKTRLSKRAIQYSTRRLEESGELSVEIGSGKGGANLYRVTIKGVQNLQDANFAGVQQLLHGGGATAIAPEPSLEPSKKEINSERQAKLDQQFQVWWGLWRWRGSKQKAREIWGKINPDLELYQLILANTQKIITQDYRYRDPKYVPYATKFLNQAMWENPPVEEAPRFSNNPRDPNYVNKGGTGRLVY